MEKAYFPVVALCRNLRVTAGSTRGGVGRNRITPSRIADCKCSSARRSTRANTGTAVPACMRI